MADARARRGAEHQQEVTSVCELLDRIDHAAEHHGKTSIGDVLDSVGTRSFGPLLLLAGVVMVAPVVGDIPGVPMLMGLLVITSAAQVLLRQDHLWMPAWVLRRSVSHRKIQKGIGWVRPVGRVLDRWSKPRLTAVVHGAGVFVIGVASAMIAMATPLMEVVPFSANVAGLAIAAYGLALIAQDGLIAILAMAFSAGTFALIAGTLLR